MPLARTIPREENSVLRVKAAGHSEGRRRAASPKREPQNAVMLLRQTALRASVLPRTALSRLAARQLCMHDDFKPKTKSYAGADGDDIHAQVRRPAALSQVARAGD